MEEQQWLENIKNDDYTSYNCLFMKYYQRLCLFVNEFTDNINDTEDIVQELFIKLWTNRKNMEIQTTVSGYLYKTAKNMALNFIRNEHTHRAILDKINRTEPYTSESEFADEQIYALEDCINLLPERCKEVLILQHVEGCRQKEIAEKLNISVKTIKNQVWSSLIRLKNCLKLKGVYFILI